jgi:hypothetical protein
VLNGICQGDVLRFVYKINTELEMWKKLQEKLGEEKEGKEVGKWYERMKMRTLEACRALENNEERKVREDLECKEKRKKNMGKNSKGKGKE